MPCYVLCGRDDVKYYNNRVYNIVGSALKQLVYVRVVHLPLYLVASLYYHVIGLWGIRLAVTVHGFVAIEYPVRNSRITVVRSLALLVLEYVGKALHFHIASSAYQCCAKGYREAVAELCASIGIRYHVVVAVEGLQVG